MVEIPEWIKLLGTFAGVLALVWRVIDEFGSYLRISVKADVRKDGWATILSTIDNKGNRPKDISYACLLVGPERDSPVVSAGIIAAAIGHKESIRHTNDISRLRHNEPIYAGDHALIPLPFFYSENIRVGDETLTYRTPVDIRQLKSGLPYAIRLFVFPASRFHRSTQDCFIVESQPSPPASSI